ncbi:MAG: elongation factor Ts [Chitinophagales bacterium]|nr:elongation factor Ts [Chitinophagales bacterium]
MSVTITAADVNKLRQLTGAGMMDCKKALTEAGGDFEGAIDLLRKKGQKIAANRADRTATEGVAIAKTNAEATVGVAFVLSCETDFVAKNADFVAFANEVADLALSSQAQTAEALLELEMGGVSLSQRLTEQVGKIGEKIEVVHYNLLTSALVVPYIHAGNRVSVLVALDTASQNLSSAGKDICMQIAAMSPVAVDEAEVPESIRQKELEIGRERAIADGKPEALADRIAQGALTKFLKDNTLLNQLFVKDNNITIRQFLASIDKSAKVLAFRRVATGK